MDITTEFRSHWIAVDGTRHPTRRDERGKVRSELQPIVNIDELREFADLGDATLPSSGMPIPIQWWVRNLVTAPRSLSSQQIADIVEELTDWIPHYHAKWRMAFVALRNRRPGVDDRDVVSCDQCWPWQMPFANGIDL